MTRRLHLAFMGLAWLVFAGVIVVDGYLLLTACGVVVAPERSFVARFVPPACTGYVSFDRLFAERARHAALQRRVREAELDLARRQGACAEPLQPARPIAGEGRP